MSTSELLEDSKAQKSNPRENGLDILPRPPKACEALPGVDFPVKDRV